MLDQASNIDSKKKNFRKIIFFANFLKNRREFANRSFQWRILYAEKLKNRTFFDRDDISGEIKYKINITSYPYMNSLLLATSLTKF